MFKLSPIKSELPKKDSAFYFKLFCQRTSIRGIPKAENSKLGSIKWFWVCFVLCANIFMISLIVMLITRFFRFDRTIKISKRPVSYSDFPEVTICSKRFFEFGVPEYPNPFDHLNEYNIKVKSKISRLIKNKDFDKASNITRFELTTSVFFHRYFHVIQKRTASLARSLSNNCNISVFDGRYDNRRMKQPCIVKPILNPLYLNCLAFSMPLNITTAKPNKFKMDISLNFLSKPNQISIENFKIDEYAADLTNDDGYQTTRVYIHQINDYPFDFNFEVPLTCQGINQYIVEKSNEEILYGGGGGASCRIGDALENSYGVQFKSTRKTLCEYLETQQSVWNKCRCIFDYLPNNQTFQPPVNLCNDDESMSSCSDNILANGHYISSTNCLPSCTKTDYSVQHKVKPFFTSTFSEKLDSILLQMQNCDDNPYLCTNMAECMMQLVFGNHTTNNECNSSNLKKKTSENNSNSTFGNLAIDQDISNSTDALLKSLFESQTGCTQINLKVDIRRKMKIQSESLVVEINTLLSQLGGICAFFTGLTFTFLAEIVEIIIFWINDLIKTTPT